MTRALTEMGKRMEILSRELKAALDRVQGDTLRSRIVAELGTTLELDEILSRTADATASIDGVDATVVHAGGPDGASTVAARGSAAGTRPGAGDQRAARRRAGAGGRSLLPLRRRGRAGAAVADRDRDPVRDRRGSGFRRRLLQGRGRADRTGRLRHPRDDRGARGRSDRERPPVRGGTPPGRPRLPHRTPEPPDVPRRADARSHARPGPQPEADGVPARRRRFRPHQRVERSHRRRCRARRRRRPDPRGEAACGRCLPDRRRLVRRDPAGVGPHRGRRPVRADPGDAAAKTPRSRAGLEPLGRDRGAGARRRRRLAVRAGHHGPAASEGEREADGGVGPERRRAADAALLDPFCSVAATRPRPAPASPRPARLPRTRGREPSGRRRRRRSPPAQPATPGPPPRTSTTAAARPARS